MITLPDLDDRRFADLVAEGRAMIRRHAPRWTNENPSDFGMTLIELFASLTELLLYRVNRVTDASRWTFLRLINGPVWTPSGPDPADLSRDLRDTLKAIQRSDRAVTLADFERLSEEADPRVARAHCVPGRDLSADRDRDAEGHVSVIVVTRPGPSDGPEDLAAIVRAVGDRLEERRLLTTQVHVVGPMTVEIEVGVTVVAVPDEHTDDVEARLKGDLQRFFDPLRGGSENDGWPFGRSVYVSELYQLVDGVAGVDYLTTLSLQAPRNPDRTITTTAGDVTGIRLRAYELPFLANVTVSAQAPGLGLQGGR